jgi:hypothetical protein
MRDHDLTSQMVKEPGYSSKPMFAGLVNFYNQKAKNANILNSKARINTRFAK